MQISPMMKTTAVAAAGAAAALLLPAGAAFAVLGEIPETGGGSLELRPLVTQIIEGLLMLLGIIAVIIIIIAGLRLVVGGADEGQRQKARDQILWAVVGLILIVMASAIVRFIDSLLEGNAA